MPKGWIRKHKRDYYYRKAKKEDLRSRSSFKLLEAVEKYDFMRLGDVVVDLGAAPGGWLQISRKIVGESGFILGVDINEVKPLGCLLYTSPSPRDLSTSRMPSSA